jgi:hypothetical protein
MLLRLQLFTCRDTIWYHIIESVALLMDCMERFIAQIDAGRDDDTFEDLFLALDVARGADID